MPWCRSLESELERIPARLVTDKVPVFRAASKIVDMDDLELTRDLAENPNGLGFASFGKLLKLKQLRVNIIPIDGAKPVTSGDRYPIRRSLYIVTNTEAIKKPEVQTFIAYYLNHSHETMPPLGFAPLEGQDGRAERRKLVRQLDQLMPNSNTVTISDN